MKHELIKYVVRETPTDNVFILTFVKLLKTLRHEPPYLVHWPPINSYGRVGR